MHNVGSQVATQRVVCVTLPLEVVRRIKQLVSSSVGCHTTVVESVQARLLQGFVAVGDALGPPLHEIRERCGEVLNVCIDSNTFNALSSIAKWYNSNLEEYASACIITAVRLTSPAELHGAT